MNIYHHISIAMFAGFVILETWGRARRYRPQLSWILRGIASAFLYFAIATYAPFLWDGWLGQHQLVDGSGWPFAAQVAAGVLAVEVGMWIWHRAMHRFDLLWRTFHQLHHSAERVDVWGAFYFHPLDMVGWAFLGSLALVLGVGLTPEATLVVAVIVTFLSMFQHANIRTPRWLGYIIVRPESHAVHHERGVHGFNYCDLPVIDMLFGTFLNPAGWDREAGFGGDAERRIGAMLVGKIVA